MGIQVPTSVAEAKRLDYANGDTFCKNTLTKETKAIKIAFRILRDGNRVPPNYQHIRYHLIFDVKMEDFRRKARYVAQGNMTEAPATLTYSSVVSRESVRIALTVAALNNLEVKTADIQNEYITATVTEKIWTVLGPEYGQDCGKKAIVVRALYGLNSAGAAFRKYLALCIQHLEYVTCKEDPDVWFKPEVRPSDGHTYYTYVLIYVDDVICIHHDGVSTIHMIDKYFQMKK